MKTSASPPSTCRSIFREGKVTKEKYTQLWAALINQMERSKRVLAGGK